MCIVCVSSAFAIVWKLVDCVRVFVFFCFCLNVCVLFAFLLLRSMLIKSLCIGCVSSSSFDVGYMAVYYLRVFFFI